MDRRIHNNIGGDEKDTSLLNGANTYMGATLEGLQTLQQIELRLVALKSKISRKNRVVQKHRRRIDILEQQYADRRQEAKRLEARMGELELEVKSHEAEITKLREALNRSKTNKEYAAILSQINTDKADNTKYEEQILEIMGQLDQIKQELSELQAETVREQQALEVAVKTVESLESDSHSELEKLSREREEAAQRIPTSALSVFERVAERHEGEALARVIQPHPKRQEYICEGCNMSVTLEQYLSLRSRDDIQICQSCGRLLVLDDTTARA